MTISGTKVEITLRKAEPVSWKKLYILREVQEEVEKEEETSDEPPPLINEEEDDDLDGIENTEFD